MPVQTTTTPANEPLSLEQTKKYLELDSERYNQIVQDLIIASREYCEQYCNLVFASRVVSEYFDTWPCGRIIELQLSPVSSVSAVNYLSSDGSTYSAFNSSNWAADIYSTNSRVVLNESASWPDIPILANAVRIDYTAGYALSDVPQAVKQAMRMLIAFWFENREDMALPGTTKNPRLRSADNLLNRVKRIV